MSHPARRTLRAVLATILLAFASGLPVARVEASDLLPPGFRPLPVRVHALVGGKVIVKPGEVIEGGTIILRDGLIKAVGKDLAPPADARIWDMKGMVIYAGFIDPCVVIGGTNSPLETSASEPVTDLTLAAGGIGFYGTATQKTDPGNAGPGYEVAKITPQHRAVQEYSPKEKTLDPLRELGFTAGVVTPARGIIRGTSALVALADENPNDAIIKADVFQHVAFETHRGEDRTYPASLMGVIAVVRQSFFDAQHYALDHADFQKNPQSRRRPEFDPALEALAPAADKKMRVAFEPGSALMVNRAALVARELGLDFCIVSCGQEWRRPDLAKATAAAFIVPLNFPALPKFPDESDWDQVTLDQLRAWDWAPENPALLRRQGLEIALTTSGLSDKKKFRSNVRRALDRGLNEDDALAALTTVPAKLCGMETRLGTIETDKLANLTVVEGSSYFDPEAKVRAVWIDGRIYRAPAAEPKTANEEPANPATPRDKPLAKDGKSKKEQLRQLQKARLARSPSEGRAQLAEPKTVLIKGATVWSCGDKGLLTNAQVFISGGKIEAVADSGSLPTGPDTLVIDGQGLHVTPGIIDCHSHTAILGSVNEGTLPSTAMARIHDVVNSETENLYQQLAGGVTCVNLLHGSANPIGGQNCVIKLRYGESPEGLVFTDAPPGIKFALGENVKQSNWGEKFVSRFPQTRMGVRTFVANRFTAARQYLSEIEKSKTSGGVPPRRDLELETIGEIIQGKRWIHCHSYRQDEILMLLRLMESFGVQIGTLQHILEGYKVADEIARHGAGASTFSDWWAYKFEVYDAIPYNGSLMRDRGVLVSFNSDSSELARHLYTEAAKAVKYGGTPETEALKFVTLNAAKQLRIDSRVGSIEPGKDADFAIWSKSPLDSGTVCLQTWIEGRKFFDRSANPDRVAKLEKERSDLLDKARKIAKLAGSGEAGSGEDEAAFFRMSLEHEFDGRDRHCLDEQ
jgi:imidazolonepropionase-like amidohydrolase